MIAFEHAEEGLWNEGLAQETTADRRAHLLQRRGERVATRQDHVQIGPSFEEAGQQFCRAVAGRMNHIEQNQVDLVRMLREEPERLDAIGSGPDAVARSFEHAHHQSQQRILVIDDESGSRRIHVSLCRARSVGKAD